MRFVLALLSILLIGYCAFSLMIPSGEGNGLQLQEEQPSRVDLILRKMKGRSVWRNCVALFTGELLWAFWKRQGVLEEGQEAAAEVSEPQAVVDKKGQ